MGTEIAEHENARQNAGTYTLCVAEKAGYKIVTVVCSERSSYYAEYYEVFCFWNIHDKVFNTVLASFSVQCT